MRSLITSVETFRCDMRVNLRRNEMGVAQKLLDAAQIGPGVEDVGGEAVAEFVRS